MTYHLTVENEPVDSEVQEFWNILRRYNESKAGKPDWGKICILVRDETGKVVGGLNGITSRGWLFVENLAVHDDLRQQGIGSKLLKAAEEEARKRGCKGAYLDSFSFQAPAFYEKNGYRVFGELPDFPEGHKRVFLWKRLA